MTPSTDTVIELGVLGEEPDSGTRVRVGPALRRRRARAAGVAAVLVLLAALGGATPPRHPVLVRTLADTPLFAIADDVLVAQDVSRGEAVAYDLVTGAVLWTMAAPVGDFFYARFGHIVVNREDATAPDGVTVGIDPRTGKAGWTLQSALVGALADGSIVAEGVVPPAAIVSLVPPGTGEATASVRVPRSARWTWAADTGEVAWWDVDGVLSVHDTRTGAQRVRDTGLVPGPTPIDGSSPDRVEAVGDLWVIVGLGDDTLTVGAFGRADLAPRWTRSVPLPAPEQSVDGETVSYYVSAFDCGPFVCVTGAGPQTRLLDRADGHVARTDTHQISSLAPGRWQLADVPEGQDRYRQTMIDVVTGEMPHLGWSLAGDAGAGRYLLTRELGAATALGVFDTSDGRFTRLGSVTGATDSCLYEQPYFACRDPGAGTLRVWRVAQP